MSTSPKRKPRPAKPPRAHSGGAAQSPAGDAAASEHDRDDLDEDLLQGDLVEGDDMLLQPSLDEPLTALTRRGEPKGLRAPSSSGDDVRPYDALESYMRSIQRYPLLTPAEEHETAVAYVTTGDVQAAARLVTANLRLVVKIAYDYRRAYKNMMDLIQEGNIGLMQAVKKFDPYKGVKLSSYAAWWIRAYMLRFILNNWRLVRLGTTQAQRKLFFNLQKEKAQLAALGIDATPEIIADRLQVTPEEVQQMDRRLSAGEVSLDAPVGGGEGAETRTVSRVELMPTPASDADDVLAAQQVEHMVHDKLHEFGKTLTGKDDIIFRQRLLAEEPKTLQELGAEFGVSRERVRQIEKRIQDRLRDYLRRELGDELL
jgi:RNA polymerase sigma-32 factor